MDRVKGQMQIERLARIAVLNVRDGLVREQIGRPAAGTLRIGMLARSVLLHAIEPPVGNIERVGLGAVVRVVIDRAGILAVVRVEAAIERRVLQALLDDAGVHTIHERVMQVLVTAAHVPLAAHEGLVARRLEGLRHEMLAQISAAGVIRGVTDRIAAGEHGRACHRAHRRRVEALQADGTRTRRAKAVHVRRLDRHLARRRVIAHIAPALIIRDDDDHVRSRHGGNRECKSLRGAAIGRIRHFDGKIKISGLSRRAAQNAATAQREAIRQRTAEKAPSIACAASARGGKSLRISPRRAAIRQRRCRGDRRSRSDRVTRR